MNVVLAYTHHRRCGPYYYARAFRRLGHQVLTVGPWRTEEPFGTYGREPDVYLPARDPWHYAWDDFAPGLPWRPDLFVLVDGGEDLRVTSVPVPWVYVSTEGTIPAWTDTPYRFAEIMRPGLAEQHGVRWLPKAYDPDECPPPTLQMFRDYDLVQLASPRAARRYVWDEVTRRAPDLHCVFGELWGPAYPAVYRNAVATWVCSGQDFITTRVFEAMASGCIVIADRTPSMLSLFQDGVHFIGYDPVPGPGGEGHPDLAWLLETVRALRRGRFTRMDIDAFAVVNGTHSYDARVRTLIAAVHP